MKVVLRWDRLRAVTSLDSNLEYQIAIFLSIWQFDKKGF